jgi:hypothetical protein
MAFKKECSEKRAESPQGMGPCGILLTIVMISLFGMRHEAAIGEFWEE